MKNREMQHLPASLKYGIVDFNVNVQLVLSKCKQPSAFPTMELWQYVRRLSNNKAFKYSWKEMQFTLLGINGALHKIGQLRIWISINIVLPERKKHEIKKHLQICGCKQHVIKKHTYKTNTIQHTQTTSCAQHKTCKTSEWQQELVQYKSDSYKGCSIQPNEKYRIDQVSKELGRIAFIFI